MWNNDFGDCLWDIITHLIDNEKDDDEAKEEALEMIQSMIERNKKELFWLGKFRRMIKRLGLI